MIAPKRQGWLGWLMGVEAANGYMAMFVLAYQISKNHI